MLKKILMFSPLAVVFTLFIVFAIDQERTRNQAKLLMRERLYANLLMTPQELINHRYMMRTAKTIEEQKYILREFHEQLKQRAKNRGIDIPDHAPSISGSIVEQVAGVNLGDIGMVEPIAGMSLRSRDMGSVSVSR